MLTGASAGSLCWHAGGPTDSYRDSLDPFTGGSPSSPTAMASTTTSTTSRAGPRSGSSSPTGRCPPGTRPKTASDCSTPARALLEAVTILPGKHAWHVAPDGNGGYTEQAIVPRLVTAGQG